MTRPPRIVVVIGTRPEAIKMAPVVHALRARDEVHTEVVLTGQHTDLVDQALAAVGVSPDHDLAIMRDGQSLYDTVQAALDGLRRVVEASRPDVVLVQGDTATVFTAALVGYFERVRVGHVEAGLRSWDKWAPFPEEGFRRLTGVLADYHFAPTARAAEALRAEAVPEERIFLTGNTVVDALQAVAAEPHAVSSGPLREAIEDPSRRLVLLTAHRRESFGAPLRELFSAVRELADRVADISVVYPVHPNPEVVGPAHEILAGHPRIHLVEPVGYRDLVAALDGAALILTDSGGIQEEAPTFGTPVLVLREVTERPEGIDAGVAELVGTSRDRILEAALRVLDRPLEVARANPYGDGRAGERIADILISELVGVARRTEDWAG